MSILFIYLFLFFFNKSYCSNPSLVATENNESLPLLHPILQIEVLISWYFLSISETSKKHLEKKIIKKEKR